MDHCLEIEGVPIAIGASQLDPSCERETNHIVGGRPLSATPGTGNRFLMQQIIDETGNEVVVEMDGNQNNNNNHDSINEHLLKSGQLGMCNDPYCTTCPTYFKASQQRYAKASNIFDPKFHNSIYGDAKGFGRKLFSLCYSCVPGVMNPFAKVVQQWNQFLAICCLVASFVDPLFFFLIYVKKDRNCIAINWTMTTTLVLLRSINDCVYLLNIVLQFRLAYVSPQSRVDGAADLVDHPKKIALHYLKGYFLLDLCVVLPVPQIMILSVLPNSLGSSGANYVKNLLRAAILIQYLPRLFRFLPMLFGPSPTGFIFVSAKSQIIKYLLIFMLCAHVVGSCWYLFGLQRVNQCLRDACHQYNLSSCMELIDCDPKLPDISSSLWSNNTGAIACLNSTSGPFPYGIYANAVPLTTETNAVNKYVFALFWAFQQISTLAGNQTPSYFVWEVFFTMAIIGLGLLLLALLIGNIQNYNQILGQRRLEMELQDRDVEQWMRLRRLPEDLRWRVRQAKRYNWAATRGVILETVLEGLPEDLQTDIRRHLFRFVEKVRIFALMEDPILDVILERLKQRTYIKGSRILRHGAVVEKVVFVVRGKLESIGEDGIALPLSQGDAFGEELLTLFLEHSSVSKDGKKVRPPGQRLISNRTVRCLTNVEVFSLRAADIEEVTILFPSFFRRPHVQGALRYELPYWRSRAAHIIQVAWRYRKKCLSRANTSQTDQTWNSKVEL